MNITGRTAVAGLLGNPVSHSLSPAMHNAVYERLGLDWVYVALGAPDETTAVEVVDMACRVGFVGLNVTMPYKTLALRQANVVDRCAAEVGGANVLKVVDGSLHAYNTDGQGVVESLKVDGGLDVVGSRVVVLGTGPTAASAVHALVRARAGSVTVVSRDLARASALISRFSASSGSTSLVAVPYQAASPPVVIADAIVNATVLGMKGSDESPLVSEWLQPHHVVLDVVYGTEEPTKLVEDARAAGAAAFDGLGMLVEQGAATIEIWAGLEPGSVPRGLMRAVAESQIRRFRAEG